MSEASALIQLENVSKIFYTDEVETHALFRETEKNFRRITGYQHLWMLKAHLDEEDALAELQKVG